MFYNGGKNKIAGSQYGVNQWWWWWWGFNLPLPEIPKF
jgi:hypothetical protein